MANKMINMDGSDDPFYRYTMPKLETKVEGTTKMIKTVLVNIEDVARAVKRPEDYLVTYFGQQLSANSKVDAKEKRMYISGKHEQSVLQEACFRFIRDTVRCAQCGNPETVPVCTGKKKNMGITLNCVSCGHKTNLDPTDRFVKYMTQHPMTPDETYQKKSKKKGDDAVASPEAEEGEKKKKKKKDKGGAGGEEGGAAPDGEKKKKKKKKEEVIEETDEITAAVGMLKTTDDNDDDDDEDWGMDTSASAVSARAQSNEQTQPKVAASQVDEPSEEEDDDDDESDVDIDGI